MIGVAQHSLTFGDIELTDPTGAFSVMADDATFGNPQPIDVAVRSLLQDGTIVSTQGHDNREAFFRVKISGADSIALADAEALLVAELGRRNELVWTPLDGWGPPTVFEVLTSNLEHLFDDLAEMRGERTYGLRLVCLPFGRSLSETTAAALVSAVTPVTVTVDDCSSASGWSLGGSSVPTVVSGALKFDVALSPTTGGGTRFYSLRQATRTAAAVDMSSTMYLSIDFKHAVYNPTTSVNVRPEVSVDGAKLVRVASGPAPTAGWTRYTFICPDPSFTVLEVDPNVSVTYAEPHSGASPSFDFFLDNIIRTNQAPTSGATARQSLRSVPVKGSVRTPASLAVQHATSALGDVLVYTHPDLGVGYQPPLRTWRTAGASVTADAATVSGSRELIGSTTFEVPMSMLPRGGYVLMARVRAVSSTGARVIGATAQSRVGAVNVGNVQTVSTRTTLTSTTAWQIVPIGGFTLPPTDVPSGSAGVVRIVLTESSVDDVELDEAWLFKMTDGGSLTQVACGTGTPAAGTPSNRLWIDSPTVDLPLPRLWVGTQADRSDARHAGGDAAAWGRHEFRPPTMNTFVVTTGALNAEVSLRHHARWHSHAAE